MRTISIVCIWCAVWLLGLIPVAVTSAALAIATIATVFVTTVLSAPGSDQAGVAFGFALFYLGIPFGIPAAVLLGIVVFTCCMTVFALIHITIAASE